MFPVPCPLNSHEMRVSRTCNRSLFRRGQVLLATVNEPAMVPFVSQQLNNLDLALALAKRGNLPGAEGLIVQQFERLFGAGQHKEAAECAADSPQVRRCLPEQLHSRTAAHKSGDFGCGVLYI